MRSLSDGFNLYFEIKAACQWTVIYRLKPCCLKQTACAFRYKNVFSSFCNLIKSNWLTSASCAVVELTLSDIFGFWLHWRRDMLLQPNFLFLPFPFLETSHLSVFIKFSYSTESVKTQQYSLVSFESNFNWHIYECLWYLPWIYSLPIFS